MYRISWFQLSIVATYNADMNLKGQVKKFSRAWDICLTKALVLPYFWHFSHHFYLTQTLNEQIGRFFALESLYYDSVMIKAMFLIIKNFFLKHKCFFTKNKYTFLGWVYLPGFEKVLMQLKKFFNMWKRTTLSYKKKLSSLPHRWEYAVLLQNRKQVLYVLRPLL